jgi:hypothetical protein
VQKGRAMPEIKASEESMFFSEEKNQKTSTPCARRKIRDPAGIVKTAEELKVFCFFFSKKSFFPH